MLTGPNLQIEQTEQIDQIEQSGGSDMGLGVDRRMQHSLLADPRLLTNIIITTRTMVMVRAIILGQV